MKTSAVLGTAGSQDTFTAAFIAKGYESDDTLDDCTPQPTTPSGLSAGTLRRSFSKCSCMYCVCDYFFTK